MENRFRLERKVRVASSKEYALTKVDYAFDVGMTTEAGYKSRTVIMTLKYPVAFGPFQSSGFMNAVGPALEADCNRSVIGTILRYVILTWNTTNKRHFKREWFHYD